MSNLSIAYRAEDDPSRPQYRPRPHTIIHCPRPGCVFLAEGDREGEAIRVLGNHLVHIHMTPDLGAA